jgi:hypothetical protein
MYDLRKAVKDYLELTEEQVYPLMENYPRYKIDLALGATRKEFKDLEDCLEKKRKYFKFKLSLI